MSENSNWQISRVQQKLLDSLFSVIFEDKIEKVLDVGSGRTSIQYLTDRYKNITITGLVFPGDDRKITPIKKCVSNANYMLVERDINDFDFSQTFNIVLAHLFLGEAEKFAGNKFGKIADKLFSIKTKYLVMVNLETDTIDYSYVSKKITERGKIVKEEKMISEKGDVCLGMTIKFNF